MKAKIIWIRLVFITICTAYSLEGICQVHDLSFITSDSAEKQILLKQHFKTHFENIKQATEYLKQIPTLLHSKGYITASIDSVYSSTSQTQVFIFFGKQYYYGIITNSKNLQLEKEVSIDFKFINSVFNFSEFQNQKHKIVEFYKNNGYPFSKVSLQNVVIINDTVKANLEIDKGAKYVFDSIRVFGNAKISKNFIHHYLNILPKSLYDESKLQKINQLIAELPFIENIQPWDMNMLNTGSIINLYLNNKRSNQISLMAGFLPSNQQINGKLLFTVDANLLLQNAFSTGEVIGIVWQQIQPKSPKLNIKFQRPYIFKSNYGIDVSFDLFKRDSSFLNINLLAGISFQISTKQKGKISFQNLSTSLINPDTLQVLVSKKLPDIIDVTTSKINVEFDKNTTNYKWNPQSGTEFKFSFGVGKRRLKKNIAFTQLKGSSFNYASLYDSLKLNTYQLKLNVLYHHYFKIKKLSVLKTALNIGWIQSPNIFRNELFQIGGNKLLRGFDDESVFTNLYAVSSAEYRWLVNKTSYIFSFLDVGYSKYDVQQTKYTNNYVGFGLGLAFETKSGYFNMSYAIGKRNDLPFSLKQAKIHFGYVSTF